MWLIHYYAAFGMPLAVILETSLVIVALGYLELALTRAIGSAEYFAGGKLLNYAIASHENHMRALALAFVGITINLAAIDLGHRHVLTYPVMVGLILFIIQLAICINMAAAMRDILEVEVKHRADAYTSISWPEVERDIKARLTQRAQKDGSLDLAEATQIVRNRLKDGPRVAVSNGRHRIDEASQEDDRFRLLIKAMIPAALVIVAVIVMWTLQAFRIILE